MTTTTTTTTAAAARPSPTATVRRIGRRADPWGVRGIGQPVHDLVCDLEGNLLRMRGPIVLLPIHGLESESAVGCRVADLVSDLRSNERGGRHGDRIQLQRLHQPDVAPHPVAREAHDIPFDHGEPDLESATLRKRHHVVLRQLLGWRTALRLAPLERDQ